MTTYTALSDAQLSTDKPLTQSVARALRDNPVAITEAASGAPRITPKAVSPSLTRALSGSLTGTPLYNVSGVISFSEARYYDTFGWLPSPYNKFQPDVNGVYRVSLVCKTSNSAQVMRIRKNGSAVGETLSLTGDRVVLEEYITLNGSTDYVDVVCTSYTGTPTPSGYAILTAELVGAL